MAFKLTTQINVQVNGGQLTAAATKIRQKLAGVTVKVAVEPTSGSLGKIRPAINAKLGKASFPFAVRVTEGSLRVVRKDIQQTVSGVKAVIDVHVNPKALGQVTAINKAIQKTGAVAKKSGSLLEKLGKDAALAIRRFGAFTVATSIIFGFVIAVKQAVVEAIDFERQMVKVSQVTGRTIEQLGGLKKEITSLSIEFGVSSIELAQTSRILSQTGLSAKDVTIALRTLAKTQLAPTFGDLNKTTEASIAIMRQFGKGAKGLEKQLSAVNAVAGKFAVESDDIAVAVRRTGGAFKAAGGDLNDLIALFTSVRSTTRESAESIATGFRTIFTRLQRTRTQGFLSKLGVELQEDGQFVGPLKAIERLSTALAGVKGTDPRFAAILEELGGFRQISKAIPLIQQFAVTRKALNVIQQEGATLDRDAALAQETLSVRLEQVKQKFVALIREVSDTVTFKAFVDITLRLASAFIKIADSIKPLIPLITIFAGIKLGRAIGPIAKGFIPGLKGESKNTGGLIPGRGPNVDSVAAVLTKGEFVLQRSAVDRIGIDQLKLLNAGKFNRGGFVGFNHGGSHDRGQLPAGSSSPIPETFALPGATSTVLPKVIVDLGKAVIELRNSVITQRKILEGVATGRTSVPLSQTLNNDKSFKLDAQQKFAEDQIARERRTKRKTGFVSTFRLSSGDKAQTAAFTGSGAFGRGPKQPLPADRSFTGRGAFGRGSSRGKIQRTLFGDADTTAGLRNQNIGGGFNGSSAIVAASQIRQSAAISKQQQQLAFNFPAEPPSKLSDSFIGPPPPPKSPGPGGGILKGGLGLEKLLLAITVIGGVANTFFELDKNSTSLEKAMKKAADGTVAAAGQMFAFSLLLENVNFEKGASSLNGFIGVLNKDIKLTGKGGLGEKFKSGAKGFGGRAKDALSASFGGSLAGSAKRGKLTGAQIKSTLQTAAVIGIIGNQVGGAIQDTGLEDIAKTGKGRDTVIAGGAISGAATGAAIGAAFGPFGIALGGAAGALIGMAQAAETARVALEDFKIAKFTEELDKAQAELKKLQDASSTGLVPDKDNPVLKIQDKIIAQAKQTGKDIRLFQGDKTRGGQFQEARDFGFVDQLRSDFQGITSFSSTENAVKDKKTGDIIIDLDAQAESVKKRIPATLESFRALASTGSGFDEILKKTDISLGRFAIIASLAGLSAGDLRTELQATDNAFNLQTKLIKALSVSTKDLIKSFENISGLSNNLLSASLAAQVFDQRLAKIRGQDFVPDFSALFTAAQQGAVGKDNQEILDARLTQLGRSGDKAFAVTEGAKGEAALLAIIPQIFEELKTRGPLEKDEDLNDILTDFALETLGSKSDTKKFAKEQSKVLLEQLRKLNIESVASLDLSTLKQAAISGQKNTKGAADLDKLKRQSDLDLIAITKERTAKERELTGVLGRGISIRGQRRDAIAQARGTTVPLSEQLNRTRQQVGNLLGGTGLDENASIAQIKALALAKGTEIEIVNKLVNTLTFMEANTQDAAAIQKSLNLEQSKTKSRLSLATIETFGSASQKREVRRERQALTRVEDVGANNVSSRTKARAEAFLNRLAPEEATRRRNAIIDRAGQGGVGITKPSVGEEKLISQLDKAFGQRELTNKTLGQILATQAKEQGQIGESRANAIGAAVRKNAGGFIPGIGNSDSVNARLTPGEFVIRKESASLLGARFLNQMNDVSSKSTKGVGAGVRFQEGGAIVGLGSSGEVNLQGVATFNIAVSNFVSGVNTLSSSLDAFPREITGNFRHSIEVIFNGAEIMTRLMPEIQDIALNAAKSELRKFVSDKLPDIGPLD